jgi:hypothetical protein
MDIPMVEPAAIEQGNNKLTAWLYGSEQLDADELRRKPDVYSKIAVGGVVHRFNRTGQPDNCGLKITLSPAEAREFARRINALADAAETRAQIAEQLAQLPEPVQPVAPARPAASPRKHWLTEEQRRLRTVLIQAGLFIDTEFANCIAKTFPKPWSYKNRRWYRECKDRARMIRHVCAVFAPDNPVADGVIDDLVREAKATLKYLNDNVWRAKYLMQIKLYTGISNRWATAIAHLQDALQAVGDEDPALRNVPSLPHAVVLNSMV